MPTNALCASRAGLLSRAANDNAFAGRVAIARALVRPRGAQVPLPSARLHQATLCSVCWQTTMLDCLRRSWGAAPQ
eukprot:7301978-Pyramimonas_sp.AAC.1